MTDDSDQSQDEDMPPDDSDVFEYYDGGDEDTADSEDDATWGDVSGDDPADEGVETGSEDVDETGMIPAESESDSEEGGVELLSAVASSDSDESLEDIDDEEFERALTQEEKSAEEILGTLEDVDALDPDSEASVELDSEDLTTDDYTSDYLDSLFPLLGRSARWVDERFDPYQYYHPETAPVTKGKYTWEHYKIEYYYTSYDWDTFTGEKPTAGSGRFSDEDADDEGVIQFDASDELGFDPDEVGTVLSRAATNADEFSETFDENTVNTSFDSEDDFFSTAGNTTITNRYDLEKSVPLQKKSHFEEIERYWVNKPYAFVILFRSSKENEVKYYVIEPHLTPIEDNVLEFLTEKLRNTIKYSDEQSVQDTDGNIGRAEVLEDETYKLLDRYNIYSENANIASKGDNGIIDTVRERLDTDVLNEAAKAEDDGGGFIESLKGLFESNDENEVDDVQRENVYMPPEELPDLNGISTRPEPVLIQEDSQLLNEYQVEKLLYYLKRDFVGFEKIDPVKRDINVEEISCNGNNSPVFVYHQDHENIISNIYHGGDELDTFIVKLAQQSGKGISKRQPSVDCTLPDGSRAQLTLGREVSSKGSNYTIRQSQEIPFTPIDLVNWKTFSLDEMAFLWLAIQNNKSLIFAGGTASGKTTSLNAVSLFIPSSAKIVSIEDTREVELPQRNWIASITRPSFSDDDKGDVDEFDLLEDALRQRPDYIVMGEIRGEEGRTLFQVMSTGHTTYTTFHANSVAEVLKRFTTDPINVSKTLFTALDLVSIQEATRVNDKKVRRNQTLTEVNGYDPETDEINVQDVYEWQAETDEFVEQSGSSTLEEIKFDRGWSQRRLDKELFKKKVVLAYLIRHNLNHYVEVGATLQAYMRDQDMILSAIASQELEDNIQDLREMESVSIQVDPEKEELVPRPKAEEGDEIMMECEQVLDEAEERLFNETGGGVSDVNLTEAFTGSDEPDNQPEPDTDEAIDKVREAKEDEDTEDGNEGEKTPELPEGADESDVAETSGVNSSGGGLDEMFGEEVEESEEENLVGESIFEEDTSDPFEEDEDELAELFDDDGVATTDNSDDEFEFDDISEDEDLGDLIDE